MKVTRKVLFLDFSLQLVLIVFVKKEKHTARVGTSLGGSGKSL